MDTRISCFQSRPTLVVVLLVSSPLHFPLAGRPPLIHCVGSGFLAIISDYFILFTPQFVLMRDQISLLFFVLPAHYFGHL
jgi:hypothetical protein